MSLRNLSHYTQALNDKGEMVTIPVPFSCLCGEPACYGAEDRWHCTSCWQRIKGYRNQCDGCMAGIPVNEFGNQRFPSPAGSQSCQAHRHTNTLPTERAA